MLLVCLNILNSILSDDTETVEEVHTEADSEQEEASNESYGKLLIGSLCTSRLLSFWSEL